MEAIGESWIFAVFLMVINLVLITMLIRELRKRRKTLSGLPKEDQKALRKEYRKDGVSNFKLFFKLFFHLK